LAFADWADLRGFESLARRGDVSIVTLPARVAKQVVDDALDAAGDAAIG
jgi:hypothetical protein